MPRERLALGGPDRLSTEDLIAVVLGTGMPGRPARVLARDLLDHCGGLVGLGRALPAELTQVSGVGAARAARLAASFSLGRRCLSPRRDRPALRSAADVHKHLAAGLADLEQEEFVVLALDIKNRVIGQRRVALGGIASVDIQPRDVFRPLLRMGACAAVVAHNHPSGSPEPSREDIALTARLREIGELIGIPLLDHVVVATGGYVSIAEALS